MQFANVTVGRVIQRGVSAVTSEFYITLCLWILTYIHYLKQNVGTFMIYLLSNIRVSASSFALVIASETSS